MSAPDSRARALAELEDLADDGDLDALAEALARLVAATYWQRLERVRAPDPPPENDAARSLDRAASGA
jgi:hypothetical protein